ncbi:J domain-containing protein [Ciceribacter sp. L1K22]|uniref:J domain-containing protein n=1 Tax=Ciceribacter sp. L1K22 TaxID=2820275 RepID=UPI001ABE891B|nr:J domain-containing protein [Ciceribacter sp. L1K22]MBO3760389.1 J domain-containing protein [Ciceribacter sp. L1K22]
MNITAFPLSWPPTMPRFAGKREKGLFKTSLNGALVNVKASLRAFGRDSGSPIEDIVISSNVTLGVTNPDDPGVAIWFIWDGEWRCIPIDRYASVAANLQALHHVLEARRVELRHGTLALVRATFQGFLALPAPAGKRPWTEVLGVERSPTPSVTIANIEERYRALARTNHPDRGGDPDAMAEINQARDEALKEVGL